MNTKILKEQYDKHIFVCVNSRIDPSVSSCGNNGFLLRKEIVRKLRSNSGDELSIRVNESGCLNKCELGPTIVIYPQGFWYYNVTLEDIDEIIEESIIGNNYIERLSSKK